MKLLVVGGGPAGVTAALQARELGADVLPPIGLTAAGLFAGGGEVSRAEPVYRSVRK